jgi:hypothetical protein
MNIQWLSTYVLQDRRIVPQFPGSDREKQQKLWTGTVGNKAEIRAEQVCPPPLPSKMQVRVSTMHKPSQTKCYFGKWVKRKRNGLNWHKMVSDEWLSDQTCYFSGSTTVEFFFFAALTKMYYSIVIDFHEFEAIKACISAEKPEFISC